MKMTARVLLHSNAAKQHSACKLQQAANNEGAALVQSASAYLRWLALVQQAQPLQFHVRVVPQNVTEDSIGQVSHIGSLSDNLLQALCQSHGALEGLSHQLHVLLQCLCCSCWGRGNKQAVQRCLHIIWLEVQLLVLVSVRCSWQYSDKTCLIESGQQAKGKMAVYYAGTIQKYRSPELVLHLNIPQKLLDFAVLQLQLLVGLCVV